MKINQFSPKARLILALMHLSGGTIRGVTRLQKLALLVSKDIEKTAIDSPFFDDWVPDKYGGRSTQVYVMRDELLNGRAIEEKDVKIDDKVMKIYNLTSYGKDLTRDFPVLFGSEWKDIQAVVSKYSNASTIELIGLSYQRYKELTINSKIIAEVNRQLLKKVSSLSPTYEEEIGPMSSSMNEKRKQKIKEEARDAQFFKRREFELQKLPDIEARKKLASLVGLEQLPKLDPMAIYRLDGLLSNELGKDKKFDPVGLVRSVRGD
jgi:hypothetical protein